MEELAEFAPSGNLRTPIQKAKNEVNALRAEEQEMYKELAKGHRRGSVRVTSDGRNNTRENIRKRLGNARKKLKNLERNKTHKNLRNSGVSDYIVVEGTELESFRDDVMKKMAEGYILQGGLSYYEGTQSRFPSRAYRQALVKSNKPLRNLLANNANLLNM